MVEPAKQTHFILKSNFVLMHKACPLTLDFVEHWRFKTPLLEILVLSDQNTWFGAL